MTLNKLRGNRVPCLGLTVVGKLNISDPRMSLTWMSIILGPYVTFYAIIYVGQWRLVSLTPGLSCIACAGDGGDRRALYAAFSASLALLDRIHETAQRFISGPSANVGQDLKFPYISSLPGRDCRSNEEIRFRILERHSDPQDYRHIFIAQTLDSNTNILVKFTRRYSLQLHEFCASRRRAPTVLGFKEIPGGWMVVAMDYINPSVHPSQSPYLSRLCDKWIGDLTNLVQAFHEIGLVHGDLREPNILCDEDKVMLIDFDSGGKEGETFYPFVRLNPELTNGRHDTSLKISKHDDLRVLRNTFSNLKRL
jgi:serine/threonine protein kinase